MRSFMRLLISTLVLALATTAAHAQDAEKLGPAQRLTTPWTLEAEKAAVPLPEYPRPQLVRKEWLNLNGLWDYAIRPKNESQPSVFDGKLLVPFPIESALSGV